MGETLVEKSNSFYLDVYPDKAQYRPGEQGKIVLEIKGVEEADLEVVVDFRKLHKTIWQERAAVSLPADVPVQVLIPFHAPQENWAGYGVEVKLILNGQVLSSKSSAFDVADHWRRAPRYGFLSDFNREELGRLEDVETLNKFHLNIIQFYDWMYRHDDLIPPGDEFIDPMGRSLSYQVVKEKITALHQRGMAAMAYGAVYAALSDFIAEHPEWGLYTRNGEPYNLINVFYIMDITPGSEWSKKIVAEFQKVIEAGFDGIHMDQYGFPKKALRMRDGVKEWVNLAECYPVLINLAKETLSKVNHEVGLIFNNVSNYPVHTTAKAKQDALYIEVWPPFVHLRELKGLIDRGRELSGDKQVILSAYLPAFKSNELTAFAENGALLTMATIFASGGYHLLLGEENGALTEAYYPDYRVLRPQFAAEVRQYYDFIVRYEQLLYDFAAIDVSMTYTGGINTEITFKGDVPYTPNGDVNTVWTIVKQLPNYQVIHLVNLVGLEDDYWALGKKSRPVVQTNIECCILIEKDVQGVYFASPDHDSTEPVSLSYQIVEHEHGKALRLVIPEVKIWSMFYLESQVDR